MMHDVDATLDFVNCENGREGLTILSKHLENAHQTIILLDLNMPVLDGWEFLDEISSANEANLENTSLYILSSSTDESDIEKAKQYHLVREFYHKPLSEEDINEILAFH